MAPLKYSSSIAAEHPVKSLAPFEIFSDCGSIESIVPNKLGVVEAALTRHTF
ncbi:hypothetical protein Scep_030062 [Stephania cephalantha]|uniref:Uncharacterized protein n=1 Tax=Stephania cephalantha TaxID=152367 RepID=A0AAP0DYZ6_9MAGN